MTVEQGSSGGARWEHFPHGADLGIRGLGVTKADAFAGAALALTAVVVDPASVTPGSSVTFACEADNDELLLVDWLSDLVYQMSAAGHVFGRFEVELDGRRLHATAWGEPIDVARHDPAVEVKAITYHALKVAQEPSGPWIAQCVIDV